MHPRWLPVLFFPAACRPEDAGCFHVLFHFLFKSGNDPLPDPFEGMHKGIDGHQLFRKFLFLQADREPLGKIIHSSAQPLAGIVKMVIEAASRPHI